MREIVSKKVDREEINVVTSPWGQVAAGVRVVASATPTRRTHPSSSASPRWRLIYGPPVQRWIKRISCIPCEQGFWSCSGSDGSVRVPCSPPWWCASPQFWRPPRPAALWLSSAPTSPEVYSPPAWVLTRTCAALKTLTQLSKLPQTHRTSRYRCLLYLWMNSKHQTNLWQHKDERLNNSENSFINLKAFFMNALKHTAGISAGYGCF